MPTPLPNPLGACIEKDPQEEDVYWAISDSGNTPYRIDMAENNGVGLCACPQSFYKGKFCKHLIRAHVAINIARNQEKQRKRHEKK